MQIIQYAHDGRSEFVNTKGEKLFLILETDCVVAEVYQSDFHFTVIARLGNMPSQAKLERLIRYAVHPRKKCIFEHISADEAVRRTKENGGVTNGSKQQ